jgi:CRISPR/Cas system-associated exonuclease Cas4 (RecB family)
MTNAELFLKMFKSVKGQIELQMSLGHTYHEAKAIVTPKTCAGESVWNSIDFTFLCK